MNSEHTLGELSEVFFWLPPAEWEKAHTQVISADCFLLPTSHTTITAKQDFSGLPPPFGIPQLPQIPNDDQRKRIMPNKQTALPACNNKTHARKQEGLLLQANNN
jgi:hypothetical protein